MRKPSTIQNSNIQDSHKTTKAYWAHFRTEFFFIFRVLTRNFGEQTRNFREINRKIRELMRNFRELMRNFRDLTRNILELLRNFHE